MRLLRPRPAPAPKAERWFLRRSPATILARKSEISPRVAMVLVALGVEMVGAGRGRETPHVLIASDRQSLCSVRVTRQAHATGEPLVLASRGVIPPTLSSLKAAAALTGGSIEWDATREEFELNYALAEPALVRDNAS
ncbi:MAG: hypothetical protein QM756_40955 [Polyangiaceae bacterium]